LFTLQLHRECDVHVLGLFHVRDQHRGVQRGLVTILGSTAMSYATTFSNVSARFTSTYAMLGAQLPCYHSKSNQLQL
jgi:hypothetical protein